MCCFAVLWGRSRRFIVEFFEQKSEKRRRKKGRAKLNSERSPEAPEGWRQGAARDRHGDDRVDGRIFRGQSSSLFSFGREVVNCWKYALCVLVYLWTSENRKGKKMIFFFAIREAGKDSATTCSRKGRSGKHICLRQNVTLPDVHPTVGSYVLKRLVTRKRKLEENRKIWTKNRNEWIDGMTGF